MKKRTLLFTLSAAMVALVFSSYDNGAAFGGAGIRNGAKGVTQNCATGGCHTGTLAPTLGIRVDSVGGVQVTKYVAGMTYTVTVTGSHATNTKFGFQLASVSGTGTSQVQAGTFTGTGLPAMVRKTTSSSVEIIEHSAVITGPLSKSVLWTAPATGAVDVKMYLAVNAVDGDGGGSGDAGDNAEYVSVTLPKHPVASAVASVGNGISVKAFPNPVTDVLNIQANAYDTYSIQVFDIAGRVVNTGASDIITGSSTISTASWAAGMYSVVVSNEAGRQAIQVVKQ